MIAKINVGASPHIRNNNSVKIIMTDFIIALFPVLLVSSAVYKKDFIFLFWFSIISAVVIDRFFVKVFKLPKEEYCISSIITAILLMLTFSADMPFWIVFLGIFFALFLGKFIFGGLGQNLFNPALIGRVFLMLSFPQYIFRDYNISGQTGPTILQILNNENTSYFSGLKNILFGINQTGSMGETSLLAIILGFIYLSVRKRINWKYPFLMMITVLIGGFLSGANGFDYLLTGGVLFGAIYFLTDPVTSPYTKGAKKAYVVLVGIIVVIIKNYTDQPEGIVYAILFGNVMTPLFNKLFKPRVFGRKKDMKEIYNLIKILLFTAFCIVILNLVDKKYSKSIETKKDNILLKEMKNLVPQGKRFDFYNESKYYNGYLFIPVYNEEEKEIAYIVKGKSKGYKNKDMEFLLGIDLQGKTLGHKIIHHQETLGLGSKIAEKEFEDLWINKDIDSDFNKEIDSASGATYTFLNFFKTVKEILSIYDEKYIKKPVIEKKTLTLKRISRVISPQAIEVMPPEEEQVNLPEEQSNIVLEPVQSAEETTDSGGQ